MVTIERNTKLRGEMFLRENTENYFEKDQSLEKNMNVKKDSERKET